MIYYGITSNCSYLHIIQTRMGNGEISSVDRLKLLPHQPEKYCQCTNGTLNNLEKFALL